ncbi:hypothetical protein ACFQRK_23460 [Parapedobacter sp. GCM10030251]|uniref:hypothetical protein n=1 Tax=Parapedobacter sp. GCM10030251 TaxID=3273419 RepID=UPI003607264C
MIRKSILTGFIASMCASMCLAQSNTYPFPASGSVGIGTASPSSLLHLRGSTIPDPAGTDMLMIEAPHTAASIGSGGIIRFANSVVASDVATIRTHTEGAGNVSLRFQTGYGVGNLADRMVINNIGNVGIGTTSPKERLSVNGNIRAKEIKVEMANWPDYVFQEDYNLMPLADLESYIDTYGHLPGIPTTEEAETEGVELAEMNRKLLEKVEELTLYILEQQREINQLKEKTKKL